MAQLPSFKSLSMRARPCHPAPCALEMASEKHGTLRTTRPNLSRARIAARLWSDGALSRPFPTETRDVPPSLPIPGPPAHRFSFAATTQRPFNPLHALSPPA